MKVVSRLLGLSLSLLALLGGASTAEAACYGSTPAGITFTDSAFDGEGGLAPEITTIQATLDGACNVSLTPGLTRSLIDGDAVFVYMDRDNNVGTGSPLFSGADVVVGTLGVTGPELPPLLGVWNGATFSFTDPAPVGGARSDGGFAASVDRLGISSGIVTRMVVGTIYQGIYDNYIDTAPEIGLAPIALPVGYSTTPPAAPAPSATPQPSASAGCSVPYLRGRRAGKARSRLFASDCDVAGRVRREFSSRVAKGRVIRTSPAAGTYTTKMVKLVVSKGRRKRARASISSLVLHRLEELANMTESASGR